MQNRLKTGDDIVKCGRCNGLYIKEEYTLHMCKKLVIQSFDTDGNRWGSYDRISFFPLPPFPKITDDNLQGDEKDDNRRRLDRTLFILYSSCTSYLRKV